jgi:hypothetical protein
LHGPAPVSLPPYSRAMPCPGAAHAPSATACLQAVVCITYSPGLALRYSSCPGGARGPPGRRVRCRDRVTWPPGPELLPRDWHTHTAAPLQQAWLHEHARPEPEAATPRACASYTIKVGLVRTCTQSRWSRRRHMQSSRIELKPSALSRSPARLGASEQAPHITSNAPLAQVQARAEMKAVDPREG